MISINRSQNLPIMCNHDSSTRFLWFFIHVKLHYDFCYQILDLCKTLQCKQTTFKMNNTICWNNTICFKNHTSSQFWNFMALITTVWSNKFSNIFLLQLIWNLINLLSIPAVLNIFTIVYPLPIFKKSP